MFDSWKLVGRELIESSALVGMMMAVVKTMDTGWKTSSGNVTTRMILKDVSL